VFLIFSLKWWDLREIKTLPPKIDNILLSKRGGPMATSTFHKIIVRGGIEAQLELSVHSHMLVILRN